MKKKLIAAVWSIDTKNIQDIPLAIRMAELTEAVGRADEAVMRIARKTGASLGDSPLGVFVAPEYMFAHPTAGADHTTGDLRHINEAEKSALLVQLTALSTAYPRLLLIPGTIAWRKTFDRVGAKQTSTKTGVAKPVSRQAKAVTALGAYADAMQLGMDDRLAGRRKSVGGHEYPAPTTAEKVAKVGAAAANYMARNTAYVLLNGAVVLKYNKRGDYHEVVQTGLAGQATIHIPGSQMGRFEVPLVQSVPQPGVTPRPITFGLEICLDHAYGTARRDLAAHPGGEVDLHIVSSAMVSIGNERLVCKPGGYLIHACSYRPWSKLMRKNGGVKGFFKGFSTPDARTAPVGRGTLLTWEIELDL
ncbi:hypothetical protein Jab_2c17370 [Janthinobacterium sp. HH01]|uniref:hypothetical protein n=1 Tax=Janthinobacterium sp. HH01 TaxID=1198452 RepID=UPI0002AEC59B|nr:hypothetical protein [Janthinobacterium sp. HH01]ELX09659.1 hypothetical protein Jab_2c17370 [Janthinobacterium sp. HH01]